MKLVPVIINIPEIYTKTLKMEIEVTLEDMDTETLRTEYISKCWTAKSDERIYEIKILLLKENNFIVDTIRLSSDSIWKDNSISNMSFLEEAMDIFESMPQTLQSLYVYLLSQHESQNIDGFLDLTNTFYSMC